MRLLTAFVAGLLLVASGCIGRAAQPRFVVWDGYIGARTGETVILDFPYLGTNTRMPDTLYLNDMEVTPVGVRFVTKDRVATYRVVTGEFKAGVPGTSTIHTLVAIWSDNQRTTHVTGNIVVDIKDLPESQLFTQGYWPTLAPTTLERPDQLPYMLDLQNQGSDTIRDIELYYDFPAFTVVDKSVHFGPEQDAKVTSPKLAPGDAKTYRYRIAVEPEGTGPFFVFKPFLVVHSDSGSVLVSTPGRTSYFPAVNEQDLPSLWDQSR